MTNIVERGSPWRIGVAVAAIAIMPGLGSHLSSGHRHDLAITRSDPPGRTDVIK